MMSHPALPKVLVQAGKNPKTVQTLLRHADVHITLQIYAQPERRPNDRSGRYVDGVIYDASASCAIAITGELRVSGFL